MSHEPNSIVGDAGAQDRTKDLATWAFCFEHILAAAIFSIAVIEIAVLGVYGFAVPATVLEGQGQVFNSVTLFGMFLVRFVLSFGWLVMPIITVGIFYQSWRFRSTVGPRMVLILAIIVHVATTGFTFALGWDIYQALGFLLNREAA